ncbi:MAG: M15 family metallopeptidase [Crocinitomicaceae bacterium]
MKIIIVFLLISSCQNTDSKIDEKFNKSNQVIKNEQEKYSLEKESVEKPDTLEQKIIDAGLVDVQTLEPSIRVELKYATIDNFMDTNVYGSFKKAYLQPEVASSLAKAQAFLQNIDSSLTLLIYDAVRPRSVQQFMWDYLDMPTAKKIKFVSNPKNGSIHNYGSAVDLTIAKVDGEPLDMGAKYDEIKTIAYPRLEAKFLSSGELTQQQVANRKLLRKVMKQANFTGIGTEWWHFNRYPRWKAKSLYQIIE